MIFIVEVFGAVKAGSPEKLELVPCISFMNSAQIGIESEAAKGEAAPLIVVHRAWTNRAVLVDPSGHRDVGLEFLACIR